MSSVHLPRRILRSVEKPARYCGGEWNSVLKSDKNPDGQERIHFAFCFPDTYEVGMSNMALQILYGVLNELDNVYCERAFAPGEDLRSILIEEKIPLFANETGRPLNQFDFVGFTLQYEMSFPTVLDMLSLGGIPIWQRDRKERDPFVVGGGPVVYNPEPVADFFDLFMIGEGEEIIGELMEAYDSYQRSQETRNDFLRRVAQIPGIYVPSLYWPEYDDKGQFTGLIPLSKEIPDRIQKRIIPQLDEAPMPLKPIVPFIEVVHDRAFLELYRGCGNGCRFCQAGMTYRPVRERRLETLLSAAEKILDNTGYEEIGLLSLSTGDYSQLMPLADGLLNLTESSHVNLSLPSLRLNSVSLDLLDRASRTRKSGLTFAPEAGSQTLRDRINKNVQESDLLTAAQYAFQKGWDRLKLYFMLGLPQETDEDILAIADLCRELIDLWNHLRGEGRVKRKLQITVSTSFFIPKPWTPYQWEAQIPMEEMHRRRTLLSGALRMREVTYQWHDYDSSVVEAFLAKGDRRLAPVLERVHQQGGWMESETHGFSMERWIEASRQEGMDMEAFVQIKGTPDQIFPWDFIDTGVNKYFLYEENQRSQQGMTSPDCHYGCRSCGVHRYQAGICPTGKERQSCQTISK